MKIIFDLDLTLIDSRNAKPYMPSNWEKVYSLIPSFKVYDGILTVLDRLDQRNLPYCIVTSSPKTYCLKVCQHWGFRPASTVCYHDTPYSHKKPHPAPIKLAVTKLGAQVSEVVSFGDKSSDIIASNAAGVTSVACLWGAEDPESLFKANPKFIIRNTNEILTLIERIQG